MEHGRRMSSAGCLSSLGFGVGGRDVATFWLLLQGSYTYKP